MDFALAFVAEGTSDVWTGRLEDRWVLSPEQICRIMLVGWTLRLSEASITDATRALTDSNHSHLNKLNSLSSHTPDTRLARVNVNLVPLQEIYLFSLPRQLWIVTYVLLPSSNSDFKTNKVRLRCLCWSNAIRRKAGKKFEMKNFMLREPRPALYRVFLSEGIRQFCQRKFPTINFSSCPSQFVCLMDIGRLRGGTESFHATSSY